MANTDLNINTVDWSSINWRKVKCAVWKLQKRIYRASKSGNVRRVRRLQKTLSRSYYAKLLAVRKVSQDNQGKKTAGVDGIKSLSPIMRFEMVKTLKLGDKSKPVRRVWIPKPNGEKRPLGISVMYDRAVQALAKMALEPEWEASFEVNSYGFRPGRSAHDAIEAIFNQIRYVPKYVLDADISKCFDNIDHKKLLEKMNTYPTLRRQIHAWLKAGVMDNKELIFPEAGKPQGGVVSPLLANIALHGMEQLINKKVVGAALIRYADDLVVLHPEESKIVRCQEILCEWLNDLGLELKPSKTKIVHTLNEYQGQKPGFDFLGFNVRNYPVGKYKSGKNSVGRILGFKTIIKPSKEKVLKHYHNLANIIDSYRAAPQGALIARLNPIINGWTNYYKTVCSKETFSKIYHLAFKKLERWGYRRHPKKSKTYVNDKYWHTVGQDTWTFSEEKGNVITSKLWKHPQTAIVRHVKVKGDYSPYNGDINYWATRMGVSPELDGLTSKLLKKQDGKCHSCGLYFDNEDSIEIDHITPLAAGGSYKLDNLQLLHRHCHDSKTALDLTLIREYKQSRP